MKLTKDEIKLKIKRAQLLRDSKRREFLSKYSDLISSTEVRKILEDKSIKTTLLYYKNHLGDPVGLVVAKVSGPKNNLNLGWSLMGWSDEQNSKCPFTKNLARRIAFSRAKEPREAMNEIGGLRSHYDRRRMRNLLRIVTGKALIG